MIRRTHTVGGKPVTGRRAFAAYRDSRTKVAQILHGSPMLYAPMAPRRERRARQGKRFRPVYGYIGPGVK